MSQFELTKSIIHKCPALKLPQTFLQKLGATAQVIPLKGCDDEMAKFILDACNSALSAPPSAPVSDERIIEKCRAAGICWLVPDADPDGFPGGFDMASMHAMRSLLSHAAVSVTPSAQQDFDAEWLAADESKQIDHKGVARYWFNRGAAPAVQGVSNEEMLRREIHNLKRHIEDYCQPAAPVQQEPVAAQPQDDDSEWRRLALQFDGHRMQAIWHLKAMLSDPQAHAAEASKFLAAGPLSGEEVLAQRIAAIAAQPSQAKPQEAGQAERLQRWASWILINRPEHFKDHACKHCVPHSDILVDGFSCVYHEAHDVVGGLSTAPLAPSVQLPNGWRQYVARAYVTWREHDHTTPDDVLDLMRDILYSAAPASQAAPSVPDARQIGREPTDAMQAAGAQAIRFDTTILNKIWTANAVFRAMWDAAAPSAPAVSTSAGMETGWLVENGKQGDELRYRTMESGLPEWTSDHNKAIRFARRIDAEQFAQEDEDAWAIVQHAWHDLAAAPVPSVSAQSPFDGGTNFMIGMDSLLRHYETFEDSKVPTNAVREFILSFQSLGTSAPSVSADAKDAELALYLTRSELDLVWTEFCASVSNGAQDPDFIPIRDKAGKLRAAIAARPAESVSADAGWISVNDRLPAENEEVFATGPKYNDAFYERGRYYAAALFVKGEFLDEETGDDMHAPSHWMPRVAVPGDQAKGASE